MKDESVYLLSGIAILVLSLFMFLSSTHTIDLSYNIIRLEKAYSLPNMYDETLGHQYVDYEQAYINATGTLMISFFLSLVGSGLIGFSQRKIIDYKKAKV